MSALVKVILVLMFVVFGLGCRPKKEEIVSTKPTEDAIEMPWSHIVNEYQKVSVGMSTLEVQEIVGLPHEIVPLYEPQMKNSKRIGTIWNYYYKDPQSGKRRRGHKLVIRFDLQGKVVKIDGRGLEP